MGVNLRLKRTQEEEPDNNQLAEKCLAQLKEPAGNKYQEGTTYWTSGYRSSRVGNLYPDLLQTYTKESAPHIIEPEFKHPKDIIDRNTVSTAKREDVDFKEKKGTIAYCKQDGSIVFLDYEGNFGEGLSEEQIKEYQASVKTVNKMASLYHEIAHRKHNLYDNMSQLAHPVDKCKADRLTEKIAKSVEYNYIAQLYSTFKKQKIKNIEIDGEVKPIDSILDHYPELKEYLAKNNYSPDKRKDVERVTEIASKVWDEKYKEQYKAQHIENSKMHNAVNIFDAIESDKETYDIVAQSMLKNIYIGSNTNIDLSHCRNLLDDMSDQEALQILENVPARSQKVLSSRECNFPIKEVVEISDYLETQGLKTSEEKLAYVQKNFDAICLRNGEYDETLKNILLKYGEEENNRENTKGIEYADGMREWYDEKGNHCIFGEEGLANITLYEQQKLANDVTQSDKEEVKTTMITDAEKVGEIINDIDANYKSAHSNSPRQTTEISKQNLKTQMMAERQKIKSTTDKARQTKKTTPKKQFNPLSFSQKER